MYFAVEGYIEEDKLVFRWEDGVFQLIDGPRELFDETIQLLDTVALETQAIDFMPISVSYKKDPDHVSDPFRLIFYLIHGNASLPSLLADGKVIGADLPNLNEPGIKY